MENHNLRIYYFFLFIVPPERPVIYDVKRRDRTKLIEPYNEGTDVVLTCEVSGGKCNSAKFFEDKSTSFKIYIILKKHLLFKSFNYMLPQNDLFYKYIDI